MSKLERTTGAAAADSSARASAKQPAAKPADRAIVGRAAARPSAIDPSTRMRRALMPATERPVVLLVQQVHDDGLEMYAEYLRYSGLAVIAVSNGEEALACAPEADIVVTGMVLDDAVDGAELVSRLRGEDSTMNKPIIVLTACVWHQERERAERAGCDLFLSKPCLPDALLREVRLLLPSAPRSRSRS